MPLVAKSQIRTHYLCERQARRASHRVPRRGQGGAVAILAVAFIYLDLVIIGLALDLGSVYHRNLELQGIANSAAMAAVKELDGSTDGVNRATTAAANAANNSQLMYHSPYLRTNQIWQQAALQMAPSAEGPWQSAEASASAPATISFVRIDTALMDPSAGSVALTLLRLLPGSPSSVATSAHAIAGHTGLAITPLAICAMSPSAAAPRTNPGSPAKVELVEFGFRRGVSYDLMNLNPNGTAPANFAVDPITPAGGVGGAGYTDAASIGPYVCGGQLAIPSVMTAPIRVAQPFPLAALLTHLNTRFDQYGGTGCNANGAPPDRNIKAFSVTTNSYMSPRQTSQAAATILNGNRLSNISEPQPVPTGTTNTQYGALWTYTQAVAYSAYLPGHPEPNAGYALIDQSAWPALYNTGTSDIKWNWAQYFLSYQYLSGPNFQGPAADHRGVAKRRVLNLPLLACPVAGSNASARVLGIGRFFMTVPATATSLYAEFAGAVPEQRVVSRLELLQ